MGEEKENGGWETLSASRAGNCDSGGRIRRIEDACFPPLQRSVTGHARMLNPIHPARESKAR